MDPRSTAGRIRGAVPPRNHNARTIAALTSNPGCGRRAVMDAAGVDKGARRALGFPARFGQSRFAITRGNAFEAQVKANGAPSCCGCCASGSACRSPRWLTTTWQRRRQRSRELRYAQPQTCSRGPRPTGTTPARSSTTRCCAWMSPATGYLEPDLIAFRAGGQFHVVEIKSFAVIDGQADPGKMAAAATQSAVYVLALRELLAELGHPPETVSHEVVLVCPENFANRPIAVLVDVRKQLTVLRRQLSRLARLDTLLAALPAGLTLDLAYDAASTRPAPPTAAQGGGPIDARYSAGLPQRLRDGVLLPRRGEGRTVRARSFGPRRARRDRERRRGVRAGRGTLTPGADQEIAGMLRFAPRLRADCLGGIGWDMSTLTALARAVAVGAGRAQPMTTVRHAHVHERPLVFVPLTLAGEANAPLAAIVGDDPDAPRLLPWPSPATATSGSPSSPRSRGWCCPMWTVMGAASTPSPAAAKLRYTKAPQVLVPNRGGVKFVRLFGRSHPVPPPVRPVRGPPVRTGARPVADVSAGAHRPPGLRRAARRDRGARRALGQRAEPGLEDREPGGAARLDRPAGRPGWGRKSCSTPTR